MRFTVGFNKGLIRVQSLESKVQGSGFRFDGSGLCVYRFGFRFIILADSLIRAGI